MNELEESEEQLPSWNRRGGTSRDGGPGVVVKSKWFSLIPMNEWDGELFDSATTPALCATPPVPGGELFLPLLQFIHTFIVRPAKGILGEHVHSRCTIDDRRSSDDIHRLLREARGGTFRKNRR